MQSGATARIIRRINRSAVLDLIREESPLARSEIARKLNMSMPTVIRIIDDLVMADLVRWSGNWEATGGRPRSLLEFNSDGYAVIGVDLGGTKMFGTIADLGGNIQKEIYLPWEAETAMERLERLSELIEQLIQYPRPADQRIRGIGIGVPGVTLADEGVVVWAPSLGWRDLELKQILHDRFNLPVVVENDVNLAALGEYGFGVARGASSLVCIAIGTGIGSGIVIDRQIHRGFHQSAGEIGYLPVSSKSLGKTYDNFGDLESRASGLGIARRAMGILKELDLPQSPQGITAEEVFSAAKNGDSWAEQIVDETVDYLSLAVASISAIIDPEVIVFGGGVSRSAAMLIEPVRQKVKGVVPVVPKLVQSSLGSRSAVLGAIMLVLDTTTERLAISEMI
jgi:glucokinase-like ROK family protein